jgi:serine phosphatase RsbU (regulator of sigma subunit)
MDQFGGEKGRKYMAKRFRETLLKNSHKSMQKQKEDLNTVLNNWQGDKDQIDDILVLGVKL